MVRPPTAGRGSCPGMLLAVRNTIARRAAAPMAARAASSMEDRLRPLLRLVGYYGARPRARNRVHRAKRRATVASRPRGHARQPIAPRRRGLDARADRRGPGGNQLARCLQGAVSLCAAWSGRAPVHLSDFLCEFRVRTDEWLATAQAEGLFRACATQASLRAWAKPGLVETREFRPRHALVFAHVAPPPQNSSNTPGSPRVAARALMKSCRSGSCTGGWRRRPGA